MPFGKLVSRARQALLSALAVAVLGQALLTAFGSQLPDHSDSYGAPLSVGESAGWNVLFTAGMGSFWLPEWTLNVLITAAILLVGAIALHGRMLPGMITASLAVFTAYVAYFVAAELRLPGYDYNTNQLAIWVWTLVVVSAVWWIRRSRPEQVEERTTPI